MPHRTRAKRSRGPVIISAATTPTRTPRPPKVPAVDPKRPARALAALDAIAIRCNSMSISFSGFPSKPPPLPAIAFRHGLRRPTGVRRMRAEIEGGRRFPRDPLCVSVSFQNINTASGFVPNMRRALATIRRVPRFRVDPDTLATEIRGGPVDRATFRELVRLALVATFGARAMSGGRKTSGPPDPVVQLEQAFARAKRVYMQAYAKAGSWFDIRRFGREWEGSFAAMNPHPHRTETFGDMIELLAGLKRKPTILDAASLNVSARGAGLSGKQLKALMLAVLDRVLGPRYLLRPKAAAG